jgi:DNA-binding MarR family transcriptional regulator
MQPSMSRPERFAELATRVARGIARLERDKVCCGELTLQQFDTLQHVLRGDARTPSALAAALGIDISTASRNIALLERGGYVVRRPSDADARMVTLELSERGQACLASLSCDRRLVYAGLFTKLPASERGAVVHALAVLDDAISKQESCCKPRATLPLPSRKTSS